MCYNKNLRITSEMKRIKLLILAIIVVFGAIFAFTKLRAGFSVLTPVTDTAPKPVDEPTEKTVSIKIVEGSTFNTLMEEAGLTISLANKILDASSEVYDLSQIRVGRTIELVYDIQTDSLKKLVYQIDSDNELHVIFSGDSISAEKKIIDYDIRQKTVEGKIDSSMYQAAVDQGIDIRAIIELADAFAWSVDFSMVQKDDTFKFIYEERWRSGEYVMPGQIYGGKFINEGSESYVFYFEDGEDNKGFFDENGNSVQKMFLKAPVEYRYISSGYTTGLRYVEAFNVSTGHRAIDYAASSGTPIRAVGDGTVVFAGRNGPYGNFVTIRHNGTYSTNYAHQSKIAVKVGQKVKQGDTIGYVGSTGFSTGPHLHYEMVKDGVKINPLKEVLPPGKPISEQNKQEFFDHIGSLKEQLK